MVTSVKQAGEILQPVSNKYELSVQSRTKPQLSMQYRRISIFWKIVKNIVGREIKGRVYGFFQKFLKIPCYA